MEKQFQYKGSVISYGVTGTGKPVMLVHGFAEDGTVWNEQVGFLREYCQLIIPDLPGSGKSDLLQGENIAIEDYAECLDALLQAEGIANCIMVGHSMGGYITLAFVNRFPDKITGFGFVHSTAFADTDEKKNTRRKGIKLMEEYGGYPFIKNSTPNLFSEKYKKEHPERVTELIERGKNFSTEALVQYYTAMTNRPDRTAVLEKSKVPVLFIVGSDDAAAPLDDLMKQVHLPAVSHIHILNGVGHMGMWENAAEVNRHLLDFVKYC